LKRRILSSCDALYANETIAVPEEVQQKMMKLATAFQKYAPHFTGAITPEVSVKAVLSVIENASLEKGDGGAFISHLGNKQWL
jgi:hypothetical protein